MKMSRRKLMWTIGIVFLIISLTWIGIFIYKPKQVSTAFWVQISGNVSPIDEDIDINKRPRFVRVYNYPNNPNDLCRAKEVLDYPVEIKWIDNGTTGEYTFSFEAPIDMEITLTTECESCYSTNLMITKESREYTKNLIWGSDECYDKIEDYIDPKQAFKRAIGLLAHISQDAERVKIYNDSDIMPVKNSLYDGWRNIEDIAYSDDENKTLLYSYRAILLGWQAEYNLERFNLGSCVNQFSNLIEDSKNCYDIHPSKIRIFMSSNSSYNQYRVREKHYFEEEDIEKIKNDIIWIKNSRDSVREQYYECAKELRDAKVEYELVSDKCNVEKTKTSFLKVLGGILTLLGALFIYLSRTVLANWKPIKTILEIIKKFFKSDEQIKQSVGEKSKGSIQLGKTSGPVKIDQHFGGSQPSKSDTEHDKDTRGALKDINNKIVECADRLNRQANLGIQNEEDYTTTWNMIDDYKKTVMKNKIYFDEELNKKLHEILGSFRKTRTELGIKDGEKKYKVGLLEKEYFEFKERCDEAQLMIKERLSKYGKSNTFNN